MCYTHLYSSSADARAGLHRSTCVTCPHTHTTGKTTQWFRIQSKTTWLRSRLHHTQAQTQVIQPVRGAAYLSVKWE